eukprot:m.92061 g.92061  ORF g.92061 m.92061 type:complete len:157 (-) comp12008_c0_seq2:83-553(-)
MRPYRAALTTASSITAMVKHNEITISLGGAQEILGIVSTLHSTSDFISNLQLILDLIGCAKWNAMTDDYVTVAVGDFEVVLTDVIRSGQGDTGTVRSKIDLFSRQLQKAVNAHPAQSFHKRMSRARMEFVPPWALIVGGQALGMVMIWICLGSISC